MPHGFCWYELRTADVDAARNFYAWVLAAGAPPCPGAARCARRLRGAITQLPARAAAQGAPPHWLGHIAVADAEVAARGLVARGGIQLGPPSRAAAAKAVAIVRDPLGAVVACSEAASSAASSGVGWHELYAPDAEQAAALYGELFGWQRTGVVPLEGELGAYHSFAWDATGPSCGGMLSIARRPHIHPQWLFYFNVADLDGAVRRACDGGATLIIGPLPAPRGPRIAVLDDPQGASFALQESAAAPACLACLSATAAGATEAAPT